MPARIGYFVLAFAGFDLAAKFIGEDGEVSKELIPHFSYFFREGLPALGRFRGRTAQGTDGS